jgi:hypothetical protein
MTNPYGQWVPDSLAPGGFRWQRHSEQPATTMLPLFTPSPRPRDEQPAPTGDVADWIDPNAPDPTPDEITDRGHPDYVEPWSGP